MRCCFLFSALLSPSVFRTLSFRSPDAALPTGNRPRLRRAKRRQQRLGGVTGSRRPRPCAPFPSLSPRSPKAAVLAVSVCTRPLPIHSKGLTGIASRLGGSLRRRQRGCFTHAIVVLAPSSTTAQGCWPMSRQRQPCPTTSRCRCRPSGSTTSMRCVPSCRPRLGLVSRRVALLLPSPCPQTQRSLPTRSARTRPSRPRR